MQHTRMTRSFAALLANAAGLETREEPSGLEEVRKALADLMAKADANKQDAKKVEELQGEIADMRKTMDQMELKEARDKLFNGRGKPGAMPGFNAPDIRSRLFGMPPARLIEAKSEAFKSLSNFIMSGDGLERFQMDTRGIAGTGTGAAGGFALPEVIDSVILDQLRNISPIRSIAQVVPVTTSDYKKLVGVGGVGTAWNAELTDRSAETASPQMAEVAPTHGELWAKPEISQWALDDLRVDPEGWLQMNVSDEFAKAEGAAFVSGDGTNKPTGFLAGPAPVATADGARAFGTLQYVPSGAAGGFVAATGSVSPADCLINTVYTLKAGYRANAKWVMNSLTAGTVRKFKDLQGRFLWTDPLAEGQPALLFGYPVVIAEDMPDIAANSLSIAFGDFFRGYLIADPVGMRIIRDEVTKPGSIKYLIGKRLAGKTLDSNAIKLVKFAIS